MGCLMKPRTAIEGKERADFLTLSVTHISRQGRDSKVFALNESHGMCSGISAKRFAGNAVLIFDTEPSFSAVSFATLQIHQNSSSS